MKHFISFVLLAFFVGTIACNGLKKYEKLGCIQDDKKCMLTCLMKKIGAVNPDNSLNLEKIMKAGKKKNLDEEQVKAAVAQCSGVDGSGECDIVSKRAKCVLRAFKSQNDMSDDIDNSDLETLDEVADAME